MAKNLKLNIKNTQLAEALNIGQIKPKKIAPKTSLVDPIIEPLLLPEDEPKRVKARTKKTVNDSFLETDIISMEIPIEIPVSPDVCEPIIIVPLQAETMSEKVVVETSIALQEESPVQPMLVKTTTVIPVPLTSQIKTPAAQPPAASSNVILQPQRPHEARRGKPFSAPLQSLRHSRPTTTPVLPPPSNVIATPKLGPTGKHINDLLKPKAPEKKDLPSKTTTADNYKKPVQTSAAPSDPSKGPKKEGRKTDVPEQPGKKGKAKEFHDVKPLKKQFDGRSKQGSFSGEDSGAWRRRRPSKHHMHQEIESIIRPTLLSLRLPISIKDLAVEMKLKASQIVTKLFMQGLVMTLNDILDDETMVQLIGNEFGCAITIDTSEEERIRVTSQTIAEEIASSETSLLQTRAPIITFMGHVDHGKTSLIDAIRKTNRAASESGSITQHIGAFCCTTPTGALTILDTPGHEAFSSMRERGAQVTDIVVLVIAGDEGMRQQTIEALNQAKKAGVTIVIALNKCDKPGFNPDQAYQQLASHELVVEAWSGSTICIHCSAVTGQGIPELMEMLALQSDILELKANPKARARGTVIESQMHKGFGPCATILVQNGTLNLGDAVVFSEHFGRIKTMLSGDNESLNKAGPSTAVLITGLSGIPEAGEEFVVVKNEKEARSIAKVRHEGIRQHSFQQKKRISLDLFAEKASSSVKEARFVLKADVQGSLEALKTCLEKIRSTKIDVNIIAASVGEISESDVELAAASSAIIIGFHTQITSHAEPLVKEMGLQVHLFDIIYHAVDEVKKILADQLDTIPQDKELGEAEVIAVFKASHLGLIAGCMVLEGSLFRNSKYRVIRGKDVIWKGGINSLKRVKEDVREVKKGFECGVLLDGFKDIQVGDHIQAYEIEYLTQEL
ncbi:MAG: translation initiation factor IF-2 [Chlamydiae bacterium]|nr:translation initiation factor IF-2 [Chlamydiota bacterium]